NETGPDQDSRQIKGMSEQPEDLGKIEKHRLPAIGSSPPLLRLETPGRLFDDMRCAEQRLLLERTPDELEAERQALCVQSRGNGDARQAGHVHGYREDVVEVHLDRVGRHV